MASNYGVTGNGILRCFLIWIGTDVVPDVAFVVVMNMRQRALSKSNY